MIPKKEKVEKKKTMVSIRKKLIRRCSKKSKSERPWSDLPDDLLRLIMSNLLFTDQERARAVCKSWKSVDRVRPANQLPWLLNLKESNCCEFFDPFYKKTYGISMYFNINNNPTENMKLIDMRICASKCGWLLMCEARRPLNTSTSFFLYSPFTKETIKLPDLNSNFSVATFSSSPTSPNCVFFVLSYSYYPTVVSTLCLGDKNWTRTTINCYFPVINNIVYSQGIFYCSTLRGKLATYNIEEKKWDVLEKLGAIILPEKFISQVMDYETYMLESNGDLLLVLVFYGRYNFAEVFRFDRSQMIWDKVDNLGDRVLFLGSTSLSVSDAKMIKGVTNRIHYCLGEGNECKFYSCSSGISRSCCKSYGSLAKESGRKIWIEPPY